MMALSNVADRRGVVNSADNDADGRLFWFCAAASLSRRLPASADHRRLAPGQASARTACRKLIGQTFTIGPFIRRSVDGIGHHHPLDRRHHSWCNTPMMTKIKANISSTVACIGTKNIATLTRRQRGVVGPPEMLTCTPVGERFRQRGTDQVADAGGGGEGDEHLQRSHDPVQ